MQYSCPPLHQTKLSRSQGDPKGLFSHFDFVKEVFDLVIVLLAFVKQNKKLPPPPKKKTNYIF